MTSSFHYWLQCQYCTCNIGGTTYSFHLLRSRFGVPQLLGCVRGGVVLCFGVSRAVSLGVCQGISLGVRQGVSLRVRLARRLGWVGSPCPCEHSPSFLGHLGGWGRGGHRPPHRAGLVCVFHPDDPRFPLVETGDGAHLHARGVRDVDFGADEGVVGNPPPLRGGGLRGGGFLLGGGGSIR